MTDAMDKVFKALADPSRRQLLDRLNAHEGQTLGALADGQALSRPAVSPQLALRGAAHRIAPGTRGRDSRRFAQRHGSRTGRLRHSRRRVTHTGGGVRRRRGHPRHAVRRRRPAAGTAPDARGGINSTGRAGRDGPQDRPARASARVSAQDHQAALFAQLASQSFIHNKLD